MTSSAIGASMRNTRRASYQDVLDVLPREVEVSVPPFDAIRFDLADLWPYPP